MRAPTPVTLTPADTAWPASLAERMGGAAPPALQAIGPLAFLVKRKTAFFCSARTPGDAILRAHEAARSMRDGGLTVISGFQSPLEKDCLEILLRGRQPMVIGLARSLEGMRLPAVWRQNIDAGRLLLISPFPESVRRVTAATAEQRNTLVAALAGEVYFAHVTLGGSLERLSQLVRSWGVPILPRDMGSSSKSTETARQAKVTA